MAQNNRLKKVLGGVAAAVALTFVAAPAAHAAPSKDDGGTTVVSKGIAKKDSGWG